MFYSLSRCIKVRRCLLQRTVMLKILRSRFLWPMPLLIAASNISSAFHCSFRFLLYFFFGFYFVPSVFTMFSHFNVNKLSLFSPVFNKRFERIKILSKSHYRMQFIMPFMSQVYSPTIRYTNCWTTNTEWRMHDRKHKFLHYRQLSNKKHNTLKWDEKKMNMVILVLNKLNAIRK